MRYGKCGALRALAVAAVVVLASCGCNPRQYDSVPAVTGVAERDVAGVWRGVNRTEVTFQPDGKAAVTRLDGREFDFDEGWRLAGTGTWELAGPDDPVGWGEGQHVVLDVPARSDWEAREEADFPVSPDSREPAPQSYTWVFELERTDRGLRLYFFFGDPDSRSRYYLERARPAAENSPAPAPGRR
ncbi:hypothetical protein [Streptomyces radiopugnans]|uniref:hypothetical protein n=1 Tax=Streptomyces radiopugnans TaxID=403935 RepID=UPI003F1CB6FE